MKKAILSAALLLSFSAAWAGPRTMATVNGKAITSDELTKRLWWQHSAQGLSDLVDERLLLDEAARLKAQPDENEVQTRFARLQANYKDKTEFEKSLKSVNWTVADLMNLLRNQVLIKNTIIASKKLAVTDEDARSFYDKNQARFSTPESARLLQIFVKSKTDADDAYLALSAGADFAKLSALKSADDNLKKNGGNLGYIAKGMLLPEIEKEAFALKPGQYTKPIVTGNGYSILKMEELKAAEKVKYDAIKEDIKAELLNQSVSQELPRLVAELRSKAKIETPK